MSESIRGHLCAAIRASMWLVVAWVAPLLRAMRDNDPVGLARAAELAVDKASAQRDASWMPELVKELAAHATPDAKATLLAAAELPPTPRADGTSHGDASRLASLRRRLLKHAATPPSRLVRLAASVSRQPVRFVRALQRPPTSVAPLELPAPPQWVDSVAGIERAREALRSATLVGVDTEWYAIDGTVGAVRCDGQVARLSTLQLALNDGRSFVLEAQEDAMGEAYRAELHALLLTLLHAAEAEAMPPLFGFGFVADAALIAEGLVPEMSARAVRRRVLDLQPLAIAYGVGSHGQVPSLAASCSALLGLGVSKSERLSDWSARPLRASQLAYAATDAQACVCLARRAFGEESSVFVSQGPT